MWEWLFPKICASCGAPLLRGERQVCIGCLLRLPQTLFWKAPRQNEGYFRLAPHVPAVEGVVAGFWYTPGSPLREWVRLAKYHHQPVPLREAARYLAFLVQEEGQVPLDSLEGILPVPIGRKRLQQRGYNQAEWVAYGLAERWGKPVLKGRWQRRPQSRSQVGKSRIERWISLEGEFVCTGPVPKTIAVVDDVLTTGATLQAALASLPPDVRVWVFTVGITQRRR
ncbi:MAG: ComF family protein [Bacteroidetes bacterium]|nr:MAG: ComF family protein [Bacteroidota bacterium]